jgi:hypothetical protein
MQSPIEEWREIVGTKGKYEVSNLGRVRKILKQTNWGEYKSVCINRQNLLVHRLVCAAFCCDPANLVVNHKNAIKSDNRASNLEAVTASGNVLHAVLLGIGAVGENNGQTKITAMDVEAIRTSPLPHLKIAATYGLSRTQVSRIRSGESWKHVPGGTNGARFVPTEGYGKSFRPAELFTFDGKTQTLTEWAKELKIKRATLAHRLFTHEWNPADAFTRPATHVTNRKLTNAQIIEISKSREVQSVLSARFGVSESQISRIRTGQRWGKLTGL